MGPKIDILLIQGGWIGALIPLEAIIVTNAVALSCITAFFFGHSHFRNGTESHFTEVRTP